jgi:predicted phage terminase large subunit-like protein
LAFGRTKSSAPATRRDIGRLGEGALSHFAPRTQHIVARDPELALKDFIAGAWHVVEPATRFVPGWHIDAISDHLEAASVGAIRNLIINMPPRHMKSLCVSVFWPMWEWSYAPHTRYLFSSYAEKLAIRDSLKCRRIIDSAWYQRRYREIFQLTSDQNQKTRFENDRTGYRIATSVGGTGTGEGGDRIVVDDPHNAKERRSDVTREAALAWWDETMSTRGNDPETVVRVIVMQRLHEKDLTGHILAKEMGYDHLVLPAEYDGRKKATSIGWSDPRTKEGELLWPQRFTRHSINQLKTELGSYAAAAQLQQLPAPAKGAIFNRANFFYYTTADHPIPGVHTMPTPVEESAMSWDMAFKGDKEKDKKQLGSDYVVGDVWSRSGANLYLRDEVRGQWEFPETLKNVEDLIDKWPSARAKYIEDKANGPAIISTLRSKVQGLIPIDPAVLGGDLVARARAIAYLTEAHNIFVPHPDIATFSVEAWFLEVEVFPRGSHDDRVAALAQMALMMQTKIDAARRMQRFAQQKREEAQVTRKDGLHDTPSTASVVTRRF